MTTRRDVQEAIKGYLDAQIGAGGTLAAIRKVHLDQAPIAQPRGNEVLNLAGYPCLVVRDAGMEVDGWATGGAKIEAWRYEVSAVAVSRDAGARRAISNLLDSYEPAILAILDGSTLAQEGIVMVLHMGTEPAQCGDLSEVVEGSQGVIGVMTMRFEATYCPTV